MITSDGEEPTLWSKIVSIPSNSLKFLTSWKRDVEENAVFETKKQILDNLDKSRENDVSETGQILDTTNKSSRGWSRLKELYTDENVHFETGIVKSCMEWTFIGTVLLRGPVGWQRAAERYNRYSKGRVFLSPRDALRRKWDYAFASFLRTGAINGGLAALYVGCIVAAITHMAAWHGHFSLWTVPLMTTTIPCMIACPFGVRGMVEAASLGLTCGLTLSLMVYGASYFFNQTVDEIYRTVKSEREMVLRKERDQDRSITIYQKEHNIWFKGVAKLQMQRDKQLAEAEVPDGQSE